MEKILVNNHVYLLGFELFYYNDEFDAEKVKKFLLEKCSGVLIENVEQTFLRSLPEVVNRPVYVTIKKAYQNQKHWFVVFELERPMYKGYRGCVNNTFVYIQGDTKIISITERGHGPANELEGEVIYQADTKA